MNKFTEGFLGKIGSNTIRDSFTTNIKRNDLSKNSKKKERDFDPHVGFSNCLNHLKDNGIAIEFGSEKLDSEIIKNSPEIELFSSNY